MTLSLYIAAILIAKSINPNFITENLVLCFISFAVCAILQLFEIAMKMRTAIDSHKPKQEYKAADLRTGHQKKTT